MLYLERTERTYSWLLPFRRPRLTVNGHGLKWVSGKKTPPKVYITRVFNFGTWEEWQEMKRTYTAAQIKEAVRNPLSGQWTRRGKNFAEVLYSCRLPKKALISYDVSRDA